MVMKVSPTKGIPDASGGDRLNLCIRSYSVTCTWVSINAISQLTEMHTGDPSR